MTKISILVVGKDKDRWVTDGSAHYVKLLRRFATVTFETVAQPKKAPSMPAAQIRKAEAEAITKKLAGRSFIALTDSGKKMHSIQFAKWLEKVAVKHASSLTFVIGGPYGLDEPILKSADEVISLSDLTFSHQVVRLVLLEQLYRAFSITHGTDYHK